MSRWLSALAALLFTSFTWAGPIQLVKDINRTIRPSQSPVSFRGQAAGLMCSDAWFQLCTVWAGEAATGNFVRLAPLDVPGSVVGRAVVFQDALYFLQAVGGEVKLWKSDGTPAGTATVATLPSNSQLGPLVATDTYLYFLGPQQHLFRSDGTAAGMAELTSFGASNPVAADAQLFFVGNRPDVGNELFVSDGTVVGTRLVKDIAPGPDSSYPNGIAHVGGVLLFGATSSAGQVGSLFVTDGTEAGTHSIAAGVGSFVAMGGAIYIIEQHYTGIVAKETSLWRWDGATDPVLVRSWLNSAWGTYGDIVAAGSSIYFTVEGQLWRSDGTTAGSVAVSGLPPDANVRFLVPWGSDLMMHVDSSTLPSGHFSLFRIRAGTGTPEAMPVRDAPFPVVVVGDHLLASSTQGGSVFIAADGTIAPLTAAAGEPSADSICSGNPRLEMDGYVLFDASDGISDCAIWRSDGTPAGTVQVAPLGSMRSSARAGDFAYFLYGAAGTPTPWMIYRTDGTSAGTQPVMPMEGLNLPLYAAMGSSMFVGTPTQVWRVDAQSSTPVRILEGFLTSYAYVSKLAVAGDRIFVGAYHPSLGFVLISADAQGNNPTIVASGIQGVDSWTAVGNVLLYTRADNFSLWRSDGTTAGTYALSTSPFSTVAGSAGGSGFFQTDHALYQTDGTVPGTRLVGNFDTIDAMSFSGSSLFVAGNLIGRGRGIFRVDAGQSGLTQLTTYTGSVMNLRVAGGSAYFLESNTASGTHLWMTSPVAGGKFDLMAFSDQAGFSPGPFVPMSAGLLLFWTDPVAGLEPLFLQIDTVPDSFSIASALGVATESPTISTPVQITGITVPTPVSVSFPAQFCISSGSNCSCDVQPYGSSGTILPNQYICVQNPAVHAPGYTLTSTLTVGGATSTFTSTTAGAKLTRHIGTGVGTGTIVDYRRDTCIATCTEERFFNSQVRLIAAKRPGYAFTGWSGDCAGTQDECLLTLDADKTAIANFAPAPFKRTRRDVNGDGRGDLMWRGPGAFGLWLMDGLATPAYSLLRSPAGFDWKLDGDFDGDGQDDVLYRASDGSYRVVLNATTMPATNMLDGGTGWEVVGKGDFNGDGKTDLLWKAANGTYGLWLMNGTTFSSAGLFQAPGPGWDSVVVADFDGDGKDDILWQHLDGRVQMWLMDGFLSKAQADMVTVPNGWTPVLAADLDGDGKADLVWKHTNGSIGLWMVDGTTIRSYSVALGANTGWSVKLAGDLDGDGKDDLILTHVDGSVGAWLMNGPSIASYGALLGPGTSWSLAGVGDFNGDGRADLAWKSTDGSYGLWIMKGLDSMLYGPILGPQSAWSLIP